MEYFQFSQEEALEALGVDPRRGLSRGEVPVSYTHLTLPTT